MVLRAGDWVEVAEKAEILATLDAEGRLDELPFMPEMFNFCGQRFQVVAVAHKTCDTVNKTGGRRMDSAVHLAGVRCDGSRHGRCDAACLTFWNKAWLRPVGGSRAVPVDVSPRLARRPAGCSEDDVQRATLGPGSTAEEPIYSCQATELPRFTTMLPWWDVRQYVRDLVSRNVPASEVVGGGVYVAFNTLLRIARRFGLGQPLIRLYESIQRRRRGTPYPRRQGLIPVGQRTPTADLGLQPGEWVRVKSYDEILATLDTANRNRGMLFDAEEVPFCGRTLQVRSRVERIIDESTGKLIELGTPSVLLEDQWCLGHYSDRRMFCPRAIYGFWREMWLERTAPPAHIVIGTRGSANA